MRNSLLKTISVVLALAMLLTAVAVGCGKEQKETLTVLNAGSLTIPFEEMETEFENANPDVDVQCESSASGTAIRKITELGKEVEILASADYSLIPDLMFPEYADWYITFAQNQMVIAYTNESEFASEVNSDNWYEILPSEGVEYGHSDLLDPCGYRTLLVWQLAEKYYDEPGLYDNLVENCPKENIRPKSVELISLLESGDLDYAFEYRSVATQHDLNFVELPAEIDLSSIEFKDFYSQAMVDIPGKEPGTTTTKKGKPIVYGITIPKNAPHPDLGVAFIKLLLSEEGQAIMNKNGQPSIVPAITNDLSKVPSELKPFVEEAKKVALKVTSGTETKTYSLEEVKAMTSYEGWGGRKSSTGRITPPAKYKGVLLQDLVGELTPSQGVRVVAKDGYAMTFSYDQLTKGTFVTYDPATGNEISCEEGELKTILAYERDGKPTPEETEGALRIAIVDSENQVTDGHWWVEWIKEIEVKEVVTGWTLKLNGAISGDIDSGTFESGAAPGCHGVSWTDEKGRTWSGIPLWLLVGWVDDEIKHGDDGSFNDALADSGYEIKVTASDGYSLTLNSADVKRNDDIIVANELNGMPLPEKCWPLRLVGPNLSKQDWVDGIAEIELIF